MFIIRFEGEYRCGVSGFLFRALGSCIVSLIGFVKGSDFLRNILQRVFRAILG